MRDQMLVDLVMSERVIQRIRESKVLSFDRVLDLIKNRISDATPFGPNQVKVTIITSTYSEDDLSIRVFIPRSQSVTVQVAEYLKNILCAWGETAFDLPQEKVSVEVFKHTS